MSAFTCPDCNGGFPSPVDKDGVQICPWCGYGLRYEWTPEDRPIVRHIAKSEDDPDREESYLRKLFT